MGFTAFSRRATVACLLSVVAVLVGRLAPAADVIKANNTTALNLAGSWVSGGPPTAADVAIWDSTLNAANTSALGGSLSVAGLKVTDPGGLITIGATTGATLTLGTSGIDMSAATQNLTINPNIAIGANQTWTVAGGRTLSGIAGTTTAVGTGTGDITMSRSVVSGFDSGTVTIVFNQNGNGTGWSGYSGNITVNSNVKMQSQGNAAAALGSGTLTLAGGQVAQANGNWTWGNTIAVTADSVIGNDSSSGLGRTLKLLGTLTSSNGSGLTFTNNVTGGTRTEDVGFLLAGAGASTYGTTTISANSRVRVGGNATASVGGDGVNAGTRGSLGTGAVNLAATTAELAFTRTDAHTVANNITGTGTLYIGGTTAALAGTSTQAVTLTGTNTYSGTTTIAAGTLQVGNGGTAGTLGSGSVTNNGSLVFNRSNDLTAGNAISGTGSLTKSGAGTLTLSGISSLGGAIAVNAGTLLLTDNNTFSGPVTVAAGSTLRIGSGGTGGFIGSGAITNDGAMVWNRTNATSVGNAISGSGSVTQQGTGTLTLSGTSTYTGPTVVTSGTLSLTGSLGSSTAVTLGGAATFSYAAAAAQTLGGLTVSAGASTITNTNSGTTNTLALGSITRTGGIVNFSNATDTSNVVTTTTANTNGILGPWATVGTNWATVDGSNRIVAYTAYTDVTRLSSGTKAIPDDSASNIQIVDGTGTAADLTLASANTATNTLLQNATGGTTNVALSTNTLRTGGIWVASGASGLTLSAGTLTAATAGGELFVRNSSTNTLTIGSVIANNTTASSLTIVGNNPGNGIVTLSGANSFSGGTTLSGNGYLRIESNSALGTGLLTFTNTAGQIFRIVTSANRTFSNNVTFAGDGQVRIGVSGAGILNLSGPISLAGGVRTFDMAIDGTFSGNISDGGPTPGSITKFGNGALTLSGSNNTFSGTLTLQAGNLVLETLGSLNGTPSVSMSGGTLFLAAGFANQTAAISNLSGTGGFIDPRSQATGANIRTLQVNQTLDGTFAGNLVSDAPGARQLAFVKNGAATLTLSSAAGNTYHGATTINTGRLVVSGQLRNTASLTVNSGATLELGATNMFTSGHATAMADSRVISVNGSTLLMNASMDSRIGNVTLNNAATWTSNRPTTGFDVMLGDTSAGAATVTVSGTGASAMNGSGGINLLGVQNFNVADTTGNADADLVVSMTLSERLASGTGGFNKIGLGTMVLAGSNDYTGGTTVSAGTLLVNGSTAPGGLTTVASAATLGGSGSIGGPTSILAGGILSPGTSPGTLTITNTLSLADTSILDFEIDAADPSSSVFNDLITGVTDLTLGGTLNLAGSSDFSTVTQGTLWRLINYSGTLTDNTLAIGTAPTLATGLSFSIDTATAGQVNLVVVPEPATFALTGCGLAAAALAAYHRTRRRKAS